MGATVTWGTDDITVTRDPSTKLKGGVFDCLKIPDAAMTLAVVAMFAEGPTEIRNVYSWRLKETERMKAIVAECTKLGAKVEEVRAGGAKRQLLVEYSSARSIANHPYRAPRSTVTTASFTLLINSRTRLRLRRTTTTGWRWHSPLPRVVGWRSSSTTQSALPRRSQITSMFSTPSRRGKEFVREFGGGGYVGGDDQ